MFPGKTEQSGAAAAMLDDILIKNVLVGGLGFFSASNWFYVWYYRFYEH